MPDDFKPLSSRTPPRAGGENSVFRLASVPVSASVGSHPLPTPAQAHGLPPTSPASDPKAHSPSVTLQKDGDRVTRIQVRCTCGETTTIECVY